VRVISLVPSVTETLTAWGHPPIACTRFCERPDLPHVGGTKNPDIEAIIARAPDLVVLDRQENRREDADALWAAGLELVVLDVRTFAGLADDLAELASAIGVSPPAPGAPPQFASLGRRAFVPIWHRPWMTIGPHTYGSAVLAALGVANVFGDADTDYPEVSIRDVLARQPDVVLVPSEPYEFRIAHVAELGTLAPVVRVDGKDLFWWGARTGAALPRLHASIRAGLVAE
jgi:ABC-type Fe3+-hydroxamate transport system substrate-binding protein